MGFLISKSLYSRVLWMQNRSTVGYFGCKVSLQWGTLDAKSLYSGVLQMQNLCTVGYFGCKISVQWGTANAKSLYSSAYAKIEISSVQDPEPLKVLSLKPGVCQNIALHANCLELYLHSTILVHSPSFFPTPLQRKCCLTRTVNQALTCDSMTSVLS